MIGALRNAFRLPDIRNKLLITGFILLIYQFAAHVPVVGVSREALAQLLNPATPGANFIQILNLLSGGAVANFSVLANGVYPYITASIIFQLLVPVIPRLQEIQREPGGQERIQRWTYIATVPMALFQSIAQIQLFNGLLLQTGGGEIIPGFGANLGLTLSVMISMTAGTMFALWLGELITEQGIGNGISLIIFSGIMARTPFNVASMINNAPDPGKLVWDLSVFLIILIAGVFVIIYIQEGVRRIPVQYGKRVRGRKQYGGSSTHIPMRINPVGMIPLIFSQAIIALPAVFASLVPIAAQGDFSRSIQQTFGNQQGFLYWASFFLLTFAFTFFYSDVMIQNQNLADNLQRQGGFIPGIRPGKRTEEYIARVSRRITLVGATFLGIIAILPGIVDFVNSVFFREAYVAGTTSNAALVLSGAGLIIVVGVVIDTLRQLEAQLVMRNYEGFMR
ncbi:MAG: preprotein translocase subunit SecY [Anaerolineae bacterium]|jgi:preprotein translocase subunit SecY|nr:preprotein translocase subunit SecY [Anaerolineae bacterium]